MTDQRLQFVRPAPPLTLIGRWRRLKRRIARHTRWPWRIGLEWKPADLWIGAYWERRPCECDYEACYNGRIHLWICLLPMLPIHASWMFRRENLMNRTKTMSYPTPPPSTGTRAEADRMAGQSRKGESQQAAGARVRAQVRDVARRAGAKPYDAG